MGRLFLTIVLMVSFAGPLVSRAEAASRTTAIPPEDAVLIEHYYEQSIWCRFFENDHRKLTDKERDLACERQKVLGRVLFDKRYCWDRSEVEWIKCEDLPLSELLDQRPMGSKPTDWWHGRFVFDEYKGRGCTDHDGIVTYEGSRIVYWEHDCVVLRTIDFPAISAVALDLRCGGETDDELEYDLQEILVPNANGSGDLISYPTGNGLVRCEAPGEPGEN